MTRTSLSGRILQRDWLVAAALMALAAWGYFATAASIENYGSDTSTYFGLARSLRYGAGYSFNLEPHTTYPPGHPLVLAGLMFVFGESFVWFVRSSIFICFIGLAGLYCLVRMQKGASAALVTVVLLLTSSTFYYYPAGGLPSEVPYLAASIYALLAFEMGTRSQNRWVRILAPWGVGALAAYLLLLRSIGVTFAAGIVLWMCAPLVGLSANQMGPVRTVVDRVKQWLPAVILPVVMFCLWTAFTSAQRPDAGYRDYMQSYSQQLMKKDPHQIDSPNIRIYELPARALQMTPVRIYHASRMLLNVRALPLGWKNPLCLLLFLLMCIGFAASIRRGGGPAEWYVFAYVAMLLIYPFDEGIRYLYPIQPFLIIFGIEGIRSAEGWLRARVALPRSDTWRAATAVSLCAAIALSGIYQISLRAAANMAPDAGNFENAVSVQVSRWIRTNTGTDAVVMGDQFPILHRLTGRKTLRFPLSTDPSVLKDRIVAAGVHFVVVLHEEEHEYYNPSVERRFRDLQDRNPSLFVPVHTFQRGTIYRVTSLPATTSSPAPSGSPLRIAN